MLANVFHAYVPFNEELFSLTLSTLSPAAGSLLSILLRTLLFAAVAGLAIYIIRAGWKLRAWWLWVGLLVILVSLGPTHAHTPAEFGAGWVMGFLPLLVAALIIGFFLRNNILAYLVVLFGEQAAEALVNLFSQSNRYFLQNGVALALLVGVVLLWMLWPAGGGRERAND
jgi:hypothetical protein